MGPRVGPQPAGSSSGGLSLALPAPPPPTSVSSPAPLSSPPHTHPLHPSNDLETLLASPSSPANWVRISGCCCGLTKTPAPPPTPLPPRNDLETLLASDSPADWVRISEMLLGPAPPGFVFAPKHKANSYSQRAAGYQDREAQY